MSAERCRVDASSDEHVSNALCSLVLGHRVRVLDGDPLRLVQRRRDRELDRGRVLACKVDGQARSESTDPAGSKPPESAADGRSGPEPGDEQARANGFLGESVEARPEGWFVREHVKAPAGVA